jgi:H+-transporting ATPase
MSSEADNKYGTFAAKAAGKEANAKEDKVVIENESDDLHHGGDQVPFMKSSGLSTAEAAERILKYGKNELPEKITPKWQIFVGLLIQPMPIMIWLASLTELLINNYLDMGILLMIQFANASIGFYETVKADDAVAALKASLKPKATVKRDGVWSTIDATNVVPGDLVLLASGSSIPADCRVNHGTIEVDQSQLTGESLPVTMYEGSSCFMGTMVVRGETEGTVEFTGVDTYFGKTAALLQVNCKVHYLDC